MRQGILTVDEERVHRPIENESVGTISVHGDFTLDPHPMPDLVGVSNRCFFVGRVDFLNGHRDPSSLQSLFEEIG